jgi:hypothetical protein
MKDANHNLNSSHQRENDALDRILSIRPMAKAPRDMSKNVLARIAAQEAALPAVMLADKPIIRYAPPPALPLPELEEEPGLISNGRRFNFYFFALGWTGLCLGIGFLLWSYVLAPLFNASHENPLGWLISWVFTLGDGFQNFYTAIAPFVPTTISLIIGVSILLIILRSQQRRLEF